MNRYVSKFLRSALVLSLVAVLLLGISPVANAANLDGYPGASAAGLGISYERTSGSGDYSATVSGSNIVGASTGYTSWWTGYSTTMVITFSNNSALAKTLTFSITRNNTNGSVTVSDDSAQSATTQSYTRDLASGASCTVTLVSPTGKGNTAEITISGITLKSNSTEAVNVTFAEAEKDPLGVSTGSCSQTGNTVAYTGDISGLTVTPATGYTFLGWKNAADGTIYSTTASGFTKPDAAITVYPYFVPTNTARYSVDGTTYYYWEDAFTAAASGGKKVIVSTDGFLPGGKALNKLGTYVVADSNGNITYTIPSGCSLVVPRTSGDAGTFTSGDNFQNGNSSATPSAYRTFTVQSGAKIICDGQLNVNGQRKESGQGHVGQTMGTYGKMVLQGSGTQLLVNGTLYCYGYISGTGMVEVSGTIYELLEMGCWNGGSNALNWSQNAGKDAIFMVSQYFVQNVEAPLKINGGAKQYLETVVQVSIKITEVTVRKSTEFVMPSGSEKGLFLLSTGSYLLREHNLANDRVTYTIGSTTGSNVNVDFGSITIEAKALGIGATITSSNYTLPLPNNMSVEVGSGVTMTMDNRVAVLPGAEIIIDEGATVNLSNQVYIFDIDDWKSTMYYQSTGTKVAQAAYYNTYRGTTGNLTVANSGRMQIDGTLNISGSGNLFVTTGGSNSDKILYGEGTLIHNGTLGDGSLKAGYNDTLAEITTGDAIGLLAGISTDVNDVNDSFSTGTYYGLGTNYNNYWYQYVITVKDGVSGVTAVNGNGSVGETNGYKTVVHGSGNDAVTHENVVGYVVSNGTFHFTVASQQCKKASVGASVGELSGNYSLTAVTGNSQLTVTYADDHNFVNCVCTVCNWFKFYASNVRLGNNLDMMFAFPSKSLLKMDKADLEKCVVKIERSYATGETKTTTIPVTEWYSFDENYFVVFYDGFAAKDMCDTVTLTVCDGDGNALSAPCVDSIQSYAMRMLEAYPDHATLPTLIVDMLNYGAACQEHFKYGTDQPLANAELSDDQKALATQSVTVSDDACAESRTNDTFWAGANLIAESNIQFAVAFNGLSGDAVVTYSFKNHRTGEEVSGTVAYTNTKTYADENGQVIYYFVIPELVVADARQTIMISVKSGGTTQDWEESVEAYVARNQDEADVFLAYMKFADSAHNYLHGEVV